MRKLFAKRPSPAMIVAMVALIAARRRHRLRGQEDHLQGPRQGRAPEGAAVQQVADRHRQCDPTAAGDLHRLR